MAILTTNISSVSLTVNGTTEQTTNISWTKPSIPSGATITSCELTGTATASMSKGTATITVNGTSVTSGTQFMINLGDSNTTSSVVASVNGSNKNASGTVAFDNLVYTVNYTEPEQTYTVTFVDHNGTVLKTETVGEGASATAPTVTNRFGYSFIGWSVDFSNVASDITTTAQYEPVSALAVKENGSWTNISKVYKKMSETWVEQANADWGILFDTSTAYIKNESPIAPTAVLYSDGALVFSNDDSIDSSHGDVVGTYTGWDTDVYTSSEKPGWYENKDSITSVYINDVHPISTAYWFYECANLASVDVSNFNAKTVTKMTYMFGRCSALTSLDLSSFNTSKVTSMFCMFYLCSALTSLNISSFNTENVTSMGYMFHGCEALTNIDLSNFNTSKATNMSHMFYNCLNLANLDVTNFNTANVTDMSFMFYGCAALGSLDLSGFDTADVIDLSFMFYDCGRLKTLDLSSFNTENVTNMSVMFYDCTILENLNISSFNTSKVTTMYYMFGKCYALRDIDVSGFDMSQVTDTSYMFHHCAALYSVVFGDFKATNITNMAYMFNLCTNLDSVDLSNFYSSNVTDTSYMFNACGDLTSVDLSNLGLSNTAYTGAMFKDCVNTNLAIYVKDEATKAQIEESLYFSTTATVVVGSPN